MELVKAAFIPRDKSREHLEIETRLLIFESDRAVKESSSIMIELDRGFKVLVHLHRGKWRGIPALDRDESWIQPVTRVVAHFFGIDPAYADSRAQMIPVHLTAMLEQPVFGKTGSVRLRQMNDRVTHC